MEIAFLTLFLGLTAGAGPVALSAGPAVVAVELLLDGKTVARLEKPPWRAEVDFGADLLPHRLVARGFGLGDREVARAEQWINLPRPAARRLDSRLRSVSVTAVAPRPARPARSGLMSPSRPKLR